MWKTITGYLMIALPIVAVTSLTIAYDHNGKVLLTSIGLVITIISYCYIAARLINSGG
jgi:hypothetical protein